jgi:crossover junction endodeoxyribonuclease RuvC
MINILGIDASLTGTGVVLLSDNVKDHRRIESKNTGVKRLIEIEDILKNIVDAVPIDLVVIEDYAYSKGNQAHQVGELGGVIRRMLFKKMQKWIVVAPSQVKKFATGKGNANKDLVLMNVYKKWGVEFSSSDEADAFVLAKIGQALLGGNEDLTKYQAEVIDELRKKYKEAL